MAVATQDLNPTLFGLFPVFGRAHVVGDIVGIERPLLSFLLSSPFKYNSNVIMCQLILNSAETDSLSAPIVPASYGCSLHTITSADTRVATALRYLRYQL